MAKKKTEYVCTECGGKVFKLLGQCPHCKNWNTIQEEMIEEVLPSNNRFQGITKGSQKIENLDEVQASDYDRKSTGSVELDRVLGGGLVDGGVVLLGGDPGIGKSTILLQTVAKLAATQKVLYVSGEESSEQIALRGRRLGLPLKDIRIYAEIELEKIKNAMENEKPKYVIIDSIQTIFSGLLTSAPGSVSQVKECASQLNRYAKENSVTMIIICHVTKDGELAGPRALEHIVDTVLYFEGDKNNQYRMIFAIKNRFGALNEVGIFSMTEKGLEEVVDPAGVFANQASQQAGSVIYVTQEGNRAILVELQALLDQTPLPNPIRRSIGLDVNRLQMLCAVIHKFVDIPIYTYNVFVSLIGGMKFSDTGIDLPAFVAMLSSFKNVPVKPKTAIFGEIGLTGELRAVQNTEDRVKESARMGMQRVIIPKNSHNNQDWAKKYKIEVCECAKLEDIIDVAFIN